MTKSVCGFPDTHADNPRVSVSERRWVKVISTGNSKVKIGLGELVAVAGADSNALTALGTAAGKDGSAGFRLHPRQKSVRLRAVAAVRLECALGHNTALLISVKNLCLKASLKYNGISQKSKALGYFCLWKHDLSQPMVQLREERNFAGKSAVAPPCNCASIGSDQD